MNRLSILGTIAPRRSRKVRFEVVMKSRSGFASVMPAAIAASNADESAVRSRLIEAKLIPRAGRSATRLAMTLRLSSGRLRSIR